MANPVGVHSNFLGRSITDQQQALYESESGRGFSSKEKDTSLTDATLVMALALAKAEGTVAFSPVYIFAPLNMHQWVFERIHHLALSLTARVKGADVEKRKRSLGIARQWLEVLKVGAPKLADLQSEPERWVAVGYTKEDALPEWFKGALL